MFRKTDIIKLLQELQESVVEEEIVEVPQTMKPQEEPEVETPDDMEDIEKEDLDKLDVTKKKDRKDVVKEVPDKELEIEPQGTKESKVEEGKKFGVILTGGSIGDKERKPKYFDTKEEANAYMKRMNKQLSPGEKSYYKLRYRTVKESKKSMLYLCTECSKTFESKIPICTLCKSKEVELLIEGYKERGVRDGTGPHKDSAQRSVSNKGRRKQKGEECPYEEEEKVEEDYRQVTPGKYKVIFYDGSTEELTANSKVDAINRIKRDFPDKNVQNVELIKQIAPTRVERGISTEKFWKDWMEEKEQKVKFGSKVDEKFVEDLSSLSNDKLMSYFDYWRRKEKAISMSRDPLNVDQAKSEQARVQRELKRRGFKGKRMEGKVCVDSDSEETKIKKLTETVEELIGEITGIDMDQQRILRWALHKGFVDNEIPDTEEIADKLSHLTDVVGVEELQDLGAVDKADIHGYYVKYVLLPIAMKAYKQYVGSESKQGKSDVYVKKDGVWSRIVKNLDNNEIIKTLEDLKKKGYTHIQMVDPGEEPENPPSSESKVNEDTTIFGLEIETFLDNWLTKHGHGFKGMTTIEIVHILEADFRGALWSQLKAKGLGEAKLEEQEEDNYTTIAKGIEDRDTADKLAVEKNGIVIQDPENKDKFTIIVKKE